MRFKIVGLLYKDEVTGKISEISMTEIEKHNSQGLPLLFVGLAEAVLEIAVTHERERRIVECQRYTLNV